MIAEEVRSLRRGDFVHAFPSFPQGHGGVLVAGLAVISQGSCYIHQLHSTAITMFIACLLHLLRATPCYAARDSFGLSHCSFSFDFFFPVFP